MSLTVIKEGVDASAEAHDSIQSLLLNNKISQIYLGSKRVESSHEYLLEEIKTYKQTAYKDKCNTLAAYQTLIKSWYFKNSIVCFMVDAKPEEIHNFPSILKTNTHVVAIIDFFQDISKFTPSFEQKTK